MKQVIFFFMLVISTQVFAQQTTANKSGAYIALSTQYSSFNGKGAIFTGAYGGWLINHKLMVGVGGYGLATRHKGYGLNAQTHQQNYYAMGYGGLMVEYTFFETKRLHLAAGTLVGGGILKNGRGKGSLPETGADELKDIDASGFYVVQPSVNIEYNVTNWFRIGAGGGYRYISGIDQQGIGNADLSAPTANLTCKFGLF